MNQLWVDKYRPKNLDEYIFNFSSINKLKKLANESGDLPHLIIEGVSGIGKKSVTMAFIKECVNKYGLNGDSVYKTQNYDIALKYPNKSIDLNIQKSHYHYNLNF
jgi:replication-associated recombination protein RarA